MSAIINRTPTGRLISLQTELKYIEAKYGKNTFTLNGMKYDATYKFNQLKFFPLAKKNEFGLYDPYLSNPLSKAGFHLTQSVQLDNQKSKSVSECLNALQALGWVEEGTSRVAKVSERGKEVAKLQYEDPKFLELARRSVLGYGVFVGFLYKISIKNTKDKIIDKDDVKIGYINTNETIEQKGKEIPLSTGSEEDTIIRTRSALFAWAITTGFALPLGHKIPKNKALWHVETLDVIKEKRWSWDKIKVYVNNDLFNGKHYVEKPLSYTYMTKSTKALRERGQELIRSSSLSVETKVKNRRFAIVYALGTAAENGKRLNFRTFITDLGKFPDLFVIDRSNFDNVMETEKDIAITSGIPFIEENDVLKPLTKINLSELKTGAPDNVVSAVTNILKTNGVFN